MLTHWIAAGALLATPVFGLQVDGEPCAAFRASVEATYDFKPSALSRAERGVAAEAMDAFWAAAREQPEASVPCLRAALEADDADPWFQFDGSALLVELSPTDESRALQARLWCETDFDDVDCQYWLELLTRRGSEGCDVSRAAERWLTSGRSYRNTRHGLMRVGAFEGSLFLYGSMHEDQATPSLLRQVASAGPLSQGPALSLLMLQATPRSWRLLGALDSEDLPPAGRAALDALREQPPALPEGEPKVLVTREQLLDELRRLAEREPPPPGAPLSARDWILNAVRELGPDDLELLRRARRQRVVGCSDEALADYMTYSTVLQRLTWSAEAFR